MVESDAERRYEIADLLRERAWIEQLAHQLVRDANLADEIVQRTWVASLQNPPSRRRPLRRWLAAVLRNFARRIVRDEGRREALELGADPRAPEPGVDEGAERQELDVLVAQAASELHEPYRTAILMRYYEDLSPRAIAERLGAPVRTIHTRLGRGLQLLRSRLDAHFRGDRRAWLALAIRAFGEPEEGGPPSTGATGAPFAGGLRLRSAFLLLFALGTAGLLLFVRTEPLAESELARLPRPALGGVAALPPSSFSEPTRRPAARGPSSPPSNTTASEASQAGFLHRGRVVDLTGQGLAGMQLVFEPGRRTGSFHFQDDFEATPNAPSLAITSGADGAFALRLPTEARGRLLVRDAQVRTVFSAWLGGLESEELVVAVAPTATLRGRILDRSGSPIEDALVAQALEVPFASRLQLASDSFLTESPRTPSSADGSFELEVFDLASSRLQVGKPGYHRRHLDLPAASPIEVVLQALEQGLEGRVLFPNGEPVPGGVVSRGLLVSPIDDQGRFVLPSSEESGGELKAFTAGRLPGSLEAWRSPVGEPSWPDPLVLTVGEHAPSLAGTVVDGQGQPIGGARVYLADPTLIGYSRAPLLAEQIVSSRMQENTLHAISDVAGHFRFDGLLDREYELDLFWPAGLVLERVGPFPAGTHDLRVTLPIERIRGKLEGRVVDRLGAPVANASVVPAVPVLRVPLPWSSRGSIVWQGRPGVTTDEQGRFVLRHLATEDLHLKVTGKGLADRLVPVGEERPLELAVSGYARVQAIHGGATVRTDFFSFLDRAGEVQKLFAEGAEHVGAYHRVPVRPGPNPVFLAPALATEIAFFAEGREIERRPVLLNEGALATFDLP